MSWLALSPRETIVVTAEMPITTPRTVKPERSLFFASVRKEMKSRSKRSMSLPWRHAGLRARYNFLTFGEAAVEEFRELIFDESERDGDGAEQIAVFDPDDALVSLPGLVRFFAGFAFLAAVG